MNFLIADLVVLFPSLRAVLTAVAVLLIVWGQFEADRIHDDGGGVVGDDDNNNNTNETTTTTTTTPNQQQQQQQSNSSSNVVQDVYTALSFDTGTTNTAEGRRLQALWRGPAGRPLRAAVAGWLLMIVAVWVDASTYAWFTANWYSLGQVLVLLWLLVTQSVVLPLQVADRAVHENGVFFGCASLLGYGLWAVLLSLDVGGVSLGWSLPSALLVTASWYVFWYSQRQRGDAYDRCGVAKALDTVSLFGGGGPLLAAGWCGLWLSLNAVRSLPQWFVAIYWTSRAQCALLGVALVTAAQWAVDYAHDEYHIVPQQQQQQQQQQSSSTTAGSATAATNLETAVENNALNSSNNNAQAKNNKVFLLNGVLEIRIVYYVSWCVLAVTAFLPTYAARWNLAVALFAAIVLQGYATSQQHIAGLRAGSELAYQKWQRAVWALYVVIVALTTWHSGAWACGLSTAGLLVQQLGRRMLHRDRKRGAHWMRTQEQTTTVDDSNSDSNSNNAFTVYSHGVLLVPTGMLIWAWGLSMP